MSRDEKIKYCKQKVKELNMNPHIDFSSMDDEQLDRHVAYLKELDKLYEERRKENERKQRVNCGKVSGARK